MNIVRVECKNKSLGIAKGLRISVLENGICIGNILKVLEVHEDYVDIFSEMLGQEFGKMKISDLVTYINTNQMEIV